MKVRELEQLGTPENIIDAWESGGIEELTELQETCLTNHELLSGRNTPIIAPTSAGKTFVGEVLAVRAALDLKRVLYVVPFRALAEEKYRRFQKVYREAGISVWYRQETAMNSMRLSDEDDTLSQLSSMKSCPSC